MRFRDVPFQSGHKDGSSDGMRAPGTAAARLCSPSHRHAELSMTKKTLNDLFLMTLKDVYYAEKAILRALPKMSKAAESGDLKEAFLKHRDETAGHVERLEQIFDNLGKKASGKTCEGIKGIIEEG